MIDWVQVYLWATVAIGLTLVVLGVRASLFFQSRLRYHHSSIDPQGGWVISALFRTSATVTAVSAWFTVGRVIALTVGPQIWVTAVSAAMVIWLLLIPELLRRSWNQHVGSDTKEDVVDLNRSERGQTLVEYGLLIALIAVVVIVALLFLGPVVANLFNDIGNTINDAPGTPVP